MAPYLAFMNPNINQKFERAFKNVLASKYYVIPHYGHWMLILWHGEEIHKLKAKCFCANQSAPTMRSSVEFFQPIGEFVVLNEHGPK